MDWRDYLHFMQALRANMLRAANGFTKRGYKFIEPPVTEPTVDRAETIALIEQSGLRVPAVRRSSAN
jgi:hypothetical protein